MRIPWKVLTVTLVAMLIAGSVAAQETPAPQPLTPVQRRAVRAFAADGILEGTSCSVEDCSGTVLRWEVAVWIIRLLDYEPTPHEAFADVDSEQPYADFVETLYDKNITVGCIVDPLRFCPERPTSRGQMAAFVTRAYDLDDTDPRHGFLDVSPTHIFRDHIAALQNAGILSADCNEGERLFCSGQPVAAAEAVEWLYRAKLLSPTTGRDNGGGGGNFGGGGGGNPSDTNPSDTNPSDTNPSDTNPSDTNPSDTNPSDTNPSDTNPSDTNPSDTNPSDTNPSDTNPSDTNPSDTNPPTATYPTFSHNDDIDIVNGECTHLDPHFPRGIGDKHSYIILDRRYDVVLVRDEEGPYAAVADEDEFFAYTDTLQNVRERYRVQPKGNQAEVIQDTYFSHWHVGDVLVWHYWIPERVLERVEDSTAPEVQGELLFEDELGNQYRRLRRDNGELRYGPFEAEPQCNLHAHPPETGNYVEPNDGG